MEAGKILSLSTKSNACYLTYSCTAYNSVVEIELSHLTDMHHHTTMRVMYTQLGSWA